MPDDAPLISVCMPVYNAERYLDQAVESILNQTLGDFEFLILDDGSTDGSLAILERYAARDLPHPADQPAQQGAGAVASGARDLGER